MNESGTFEFHDKDSIISFYIKELEIIKITADGDFYVKGNLVENDIQVFKAFKEFLTESGFMSGAGSHENN